MSFDPATLLQIKAARPDWSTWLSANAGSGKTRVLTDRVARLLLDQVDPQDILCLTYTKAAASEMQNRLFKRLGAWAMLDDKSLSAELKKLGLEGPIPNAQLKSARRLFASAIETPGGLKIQTIHSFCSGVLRRFPLEAGVSPHFVEMDERTAALLRAETIEFLAAGDKSALFYEMARHFTGDDLDELAAEIVRCREFFQREPDRAAINAQFGLNDTSEKHNALQIAFDGSEGVLFQQLIPLLQKTATATYTKLADKLSGLNTTAPTMSDLNTLFEELLYQSTSKGKYRKWDSKSANFPQSNHTKARTFLEPIIPELHAFMDRVAAAKVFCFAIDATAKSHVLHEFARVFIPAYDTAKQSRGLLDFDDLILRTRDLLTDSDVATWVLFRLDGTIDHILVDEAQDTSPTQWQVIERLAQEFTSGQGARNDRSRTIFVVGDKKQSIYSFQGADPGEFDRMRADFAARLQASPKPLQTLEMEYSFRSSKCILSLVDLTFEKAEKSGFAPDQTHKSHKSELPGRVDLWPYVLKPGKEDPPPWHMPVDVKASNDPETVLARHIADTIEGLIRTKHPIPISDAVDGKHASRAIRAGDFLILVQRRSELFYDIIRECKERRLPIAGADRLKVGAELAVRDLSALLSFLATPEDDYSLAVALKSPLFGWSETDLYHLAQPRGSQYLWQALRDRPKDYPETLDVLHDLRNKADFLRPYDLLERILTRHQGRYNLLSRLGPEADEGIDALLAQSMTYEQKNVDSLTGFLVWLEADELEVKRQIETDGDVIRVMTVHGAKGLEAQS